MSPYIRYMTTIVTKYGKFRYNSLPMGICTSGGDFQAKLDYILGVIECVKTYINDILYLINYSYLKYIGHIELILSGINKNGLKSITIDKVLD